MFFNRQHKSAETGNALMFVLIGVVLFAALAFTMSKTNRSTGTISMENALLNAQEIIAYAEKINSAVENIMLQNDCLTSEVNFNNTTVAGYANANSPASKKCDIFDKKGGDIFYEPPPSSALDTVAAAAAGFPTGTLVGQYLFAGNVCVDKAATGIYSSCAAGNEELLVILPWVNATVCDAINQTLGNTAVMLVDDAASFDSTKFTGSFAPTYAIGNAGYTTYPSGCYRSTAATTPGAGYHFYMALQAR